MCSDEAPGPHSPTSQNELGMSFLRRAEELSQELGRTYGELGLHLTPASQRITDQYSFWQAFFHINSHKKKTPIIWILITAVQLEFDIILKSQIEENNLPGVFLEGHGPLSGFHTAGTAGVLSRKTWLYRIFRHTTKSHFKDLHSVTHITGIPVDVLSPKCMWRDVTSDRKPPELVPLNILHLPIEGHWGNTTLVSEPRMVALS